MSEGHVPVMLGEVVAAFAPLLAEKPGARIVDATFGGGGYSRALLAAGAHVLGIDRDPAALSRAQKLAAEFPGRLSFAHGAFGALHARLAEAGWASPVDGVVFDLGVSSFQLDEAARGFSFMRAGPLDMRMDPGQSEAAADLVNHAEAATLEEIFRDYGEEKRARRVVQFILAARPIADTAALAAVVERALGRDGRKHPATRVFQALRIAVNDEMSELTRGLHAAEAVLAPGGRLVVVSFHSLEDRLVKRFFVERGGRSASGSRHAPALTAQAPSFALKGEAREPAQGQGPTPEEEARNPRARSARLRWGRRLSAGQLAAGTESERRRS